MKSRKLLALFLAIFMLASMIVPASAEITPDVNVTNGIVGYDASLVEKLTEAEMAAIPDIKTIPTKPMEPTAPVKPAEVKKPDDLADNATDEEKDTYNTALEKYNKYVAALAQYNDVDLPAYNKAWDELKTTDEYKAWNNRTLGKAYKITDAAGWTHFDALMDQLISLSGVTVYLANDIDFNNAVISPIGVSVKVTKDVGKETTTVNDLKWNVYSFGGVFDGQGYSLKNVTIRPEIKSQVNNQFFGVFGVITSNETNASAIRNLVIDSSVTIDAFKTVDGTALSYNHNQWQGAHVAGLVGTAESFYTTYDAEITIYNVCNKADIIFDSRNAAGIVNMAKLCDLTVMNCTNEGDLTQKTFLRGYNNKAAIGGIVGRFGESDKARSYSGKIINCRNAGDILVHSVNPTVGGILGGAFDVSMSHTLEITNCINNGDLGYSEVSGMDTTTVSWQAFSGIYGWTDDKTNLTVTIDGCMNYGNLNAAKDSFETAISRTSKKTEVKDQNTGAVTATYQLTFNVKNSKSIPGGADPTYNMIAKYYQMSTETYEYNGEDCYSLRLVALHNGELNVLDSFSYDVTITYDGLETPLKATTGKLTTVQTSILATNMGENATEITAEMLDCDYLSAVRIDKIPTRVGKITVTITPYMYKGDTTTTAAPITFTVDPAVYNVAA